MTANNDRYIQHLDLTKQQQDELIAYNKKGAEFFKKALNIQDEVKIMTPNNNRYTRHLKLTEKQEQELIAYNKAGADYFKKAFQHRAKARAEAELSLIHI